MPSEKGIFILFFRINPNKKNVNNCKQLKGWGSYKPFYSPQCLLNEWINNAIYLTLGLSTRLEPEARIRVLTVSLGGKSSGKPR